MKKVNFQKSFITQTRSDASKRPAYNSDLKLERSESEALEEQTALLRIVRFTVNNDSEYVKEQLGPEVVEQVKAKNDGTLGKGKFVHVDYFGDDEFIVEVYKAVRKSETLRKLFEGVYKMMELETSPFAGVFNKIVNDEVDLSTEDGREEVAEDVLNAFIREAMEGKFGGPKKSNRDFPRGGKIVFGDGDIMEQLFGDEDREPIAESESDNCKCPACRARRAAGIPKKDNLGHE